MNNKIYVAILAGTFGTTAFAESSVTVGYESLDATLSSGGVSVSTDGSGYSLSALIEIPDTNFGIIADYSSVSGSISGINWSISGTTLVAGYRVIDTLDAETGTGAEVLLGLGYTSSTGDMTSGGTKYTVDGDATSVMAQVKGNLSPSISLAGQLASDIEGDSDPIIGLSLGYQITENGSISMGYSSSNSTSTSGVKTELTGWSIGWTTSF